MPIPTETENPTGLHRRYVVTKASGEPVDERAEYFVLRLDEHGDDPHHLAACRIAALAYADAIQDHLPQLAHDLRVRCGADPDSAPHDLVRHPFELLEPPGFDRGNRYIQVSLNEDIGYFSRDVELLCDELRQFWDNDPRAGQCIAFDVVELDEEKARTAPEFRGW